MFFLIGLGTNGVCIESMLSEKVPTTTPSGFDDTEEIATTCITYGPKRTMHKRIDALSHSRSVSTVKLAKTTLVTNGSAIQEVQCSSCRVLDQQREANGTMKRPHTKDDVPTEGDADRLAKTHRTEQSTTVSHDLVIAELRNIILLHALLIGYEKKNMT